MSTETVKAWEAGFAAALKSAELYDLERGRLGRALTDTEVRRLAEFWVYPIRYVKRDEQSELT